MSAFGLPIAAATETAGALADLAIILAAAKLGEELFKRINQPGLVGEVLAGLLIGPPVLGLVELSEVVEVFAELGIVFLLFWVGLETRIHEMRSVGATAVKVGVLGVIVPFACGTGAGLSFDQSIETSLFIGAALAATSVGITSAVFAELGIVASRAAKTVLGAAVIDDILALILVAIAAGVAAEGGVDLTQVVTALAIALAFVVLFGLGGTAVARAAPQLLEAPRFSESPLMPAVILCLAIAAIAAEVGLATIIGAFLAGMIVAETKAQTPIEAEVAPLYALFPPFFFASIGMALDLDALTSADALLLLAGLTALAIVTKVVATWPFVRSMGREGVVVAAGMVPRGEVGIVVAGIGSTIGVIEQDLFAAIVGMSVVTALIVPPVLRRAVRSPSSPVPETRGRSRGTHAGRTG